MKFKPVKSAALTKIRELSTLCREAGQMTVQFAEHSEPLGAGLVNEYVKSLEYVPQGEYWRRPSVEEARLMLEKAIQQDLAYLQPCAEPEPAAKLVTWFLELFGSESLELYSTHGWDRDRASYSADWLELSAATFQLGVVAVSPRHIGLFLIEDED